MNVSAISAAAVYNAPEAAKPAPAPASSPLPQDTVSLSSAAQRASAGDVDHDGDSH